MTSYSQRGEDEAIVRIVAEAKRRRFLDIGAWHPMKFSNTRALYEMGWTGVMIEPSPGPLRDLLDAYGLLPSDMQVVSALVGTESGIVPIELSDDGTSTTDQTIKQRWDPASYYATLFSPVITIPQILNQFGAFDFVSIDTEGSSFEILKAVLATEMMPRCIAVEHDGRFVEISAAARARGYRIELVSEENVVLSI